MSPPDERPRAFAAPWHAEAFVMVVALNEAGHLEWSDWATTLGRALEANTTTDNPEDAYYTAWLRALEEILDRSGLIGERERLARVAAWDRAAKATPHGQPISLDRGSQITPDRNAT